MKKILLLLFLFLVLTNNVFALEEFVFKRTYNQKVYELANNQKKYEIHTAQIHYKDSDGYYSLIKTNLTYDEKNAVWHNEKASYHCIIPEYSDSWFEFYNAYEGVNHTLKAKPICNHVQGKYTESAEGNFVLYSDAFGKGIDLKVYSYWAGLKKVIVVNKAPEDLKTPLTFNFELSLPQKEEIESSKTVTTLTSVIDAKSLIEWDKSSELEFKGKDLKIGYDNKFSYFRDALMWDSNGLVEKVEIKLYQKDGATYLRKTIPAEFLQKATFPIYTDHPTSYYAGAGDGYIYYGNSNWDTSHDSSTGTVNYTGNGFYTRALYDEFYLGYTIYRSFIPIDTSGIDDGATILAAKLYVYKQSATEDQDNDGNDWINVVQTSQATTNSLTSEDFDQCGSIDNPTEGATRIDLTAGFPNNAFTYFTLNATGISWISKTDFTKLGLREGHDCIDSAIANNSFNGIYIQSSENTNDPYLEVNVSAGETPTEKRRIIVFEDY